MDYEALKLALDRAIESLSGHQVSPSSLQISARSPLIRGGFGDVQLGWFRRTRRPPMKIAVKKLRPAGDDHQRLRVAVALAREIRIWSRLDHPNIVQLIGFHLDMNEDVMWLVSKWEALGNVVGYLAANDVDQSSGPQLALDTALGLAYLHTQSPAVCHGDIKGANVLVSQDRRAIWCDFGLARAVDDNPTGLTTSRSGAGTVRYLSPELLEEDSPFKTFKSDVWAWACVFMEIMAGRTPYSAARTDSLIIRAIARGDLPAPVTDLAIPDYGKELLGKCWSPDPILRPTAGLCVEVLSRRPASLFEACCYVSVDDIPSDYKTEGDGWHAIHNVAFSGTYDMTFQSVWRHMEPMQYQLSPDGQYIAVPEDKGVKIYEHDAIRDLALNFSETIPTVTIDSDVFAGGVCFGSRRSLLGVGFQNGHIQIWSLSRRRLQLELVDHPAPVSSLAFANHDTILVSASLDDNTIRSWDVKSGALIRATEVEGIRNLIASPDHSFIFAERWGGRRPLLCDSERGGSYSMPPGDCIATAVPQSYSFLTGDQDGLEIWDLRTLAELPPTIDGPWLLPVTGTLLDGPQSGIDSLSVSSDGKLAASGSAISDDLVLWDLPTRKPILKIRGDRLLTVFYVTFMPGSTTLEGTLTFTNYDENAGENGHFMQFLRYKLR